VGIATRYLFSSEGEAPLGKAPQFTLQYWLDACRQEKIPLVEIKKKRIISGIINMN
jgi:hypothetical protein